MKAGHGLGLVAGGQTGASPGNIIEAAGNRGVLVGGLVVPAASDGGPQPGGRVKGTAANGRAIATRHVGPATGHGANAAAGNV